jgi:hypothetical protein
MLLGLRRQPAATGGGPPARTAGAHPAHRLDRLGGARGRHLLSQRLGHAGALGGELRPPAADPVARPGYPPHTLRHPPARTGRANPRTAGAPAGRRRRTDGAGAVGGRRAGMRPCRASMPATTWRWRCCPRAWPSRGIRSTCSSTAAWKASPPSPRGAARWPAFHCPEGAAGASLWQQYMPHLRPRQQVLIRLAKRSAGHMVAPGNPKKLRGIRDLTRPNVRFPQPPERRRHASAARLAAAGERHRGARPSPAMATWR